MDVFKSRVFYITQVQNGRADFSGHQWRYLEGALPLSADVTPPTSAYFRSYAASVPKKVDDFNNLHLPFNFAVWVFVMISIGCVALAFLAIDKWSVKSNYDNFTLCTKSYAIMINESISSQLTDINTTIPNQILLLTWLLSSFLISLAYQSNLLASFLAIKYEGPIDSFQDIIDKDLKMYLWGDKEQNRKFFSYSKVSLMAFEQGHVKKNAIYEYDGVYLAQHIFDDLMDGKAVIPGGFPRERISGPDFLFAPSGSTFDNV